MSPPGISENGGHEVEEDVEEEEEEEKEADDDDGLPSVFPPVRIPTGGND